jgi:hypothetical protein
MPQSCLRFAPGHQPDNQSYRVKIAKNERLSIVRGIARIIAGKPTHIPAA